MEAPKTKALAQIQAQIYLCFESRSPALQVDSDPQGMPKNTGVDSLSLLQRIFPTQELNQGLLYCRQVLYQPSYQGSLFLQMFIIQDRDLVMAHMVKKPPVNAGDVRNTGSIPGSGRSPGEGHGNPLQYSCLENPMDRGALWAIVHRHAKSQTWLKSLGTSPMIRTKK